MSHPILQQGSVGPAVSELQRLLNGKEGPIPPLPVNGSFDARTRSVVIDYQSDQWLVQDGIVGKCTWNALQDTEEYNILDEPAMMIPQPTPNTCWAASTAMLKDQCVLARGPFDLDNNGGLVNDSDLTTPENTTKFARYHHLHLLPPMSWTARGLAGLMRSHGRLMVDLLWNAASYASGRGSSGHMVILAGIRGDGTESGTTVLIYNPLPVGRGTVESINYMRLMRSYPAFTYQIYYR
jgi:hypothetical protein